MFSLDFIDRYFTTASDYLLRRPRWFFAARSDDPNRYSSPIPFFLLNMTLLGIGGATGLKLSATLIDPTGEAAELRKILIAVEAKSAVPIVLLIGTTSVVLTAALMKFGALLVKAPLTFRSSIENSCFWTTFHAISLIPLGFAAMTAVMFGGFPRHDYGSTHAYLLTAGGVAYASYLVGIGYSVAGAAALAKVRIRRMAFGYALAIVVCSIASNAVFFAVSHLLNS